MNLRGAKLRRWIVVSLVVAGVVVVIAGLSVVLYPNGSTSSASNSDVATSPKILPAKVEPVPGTSVKRVTLTEDAVKRLNIQTAVVRDAQIPEKRRTAIPYAAVLYDRSGETWAYTNTEPRVYLRQRITIDYIDRDVAVLTDGPAVGTSVVTVGVAEIYGAEMGIG